VADQFISVSIEDIIVGEPLPVTLYIYIDFRFITFRADGDIFDRQTFDRLQFKRVKNLFIQSESKDKFFEWTQKKSQTLVPKEKPISKAFSKAREDVHRKTLDIFQSAHPDKIIQKTVEASKKLVLEVMKVPYAIQNLSQLQTYSRGTVDHSVNVSILSVYLAMQMGYTHHVILQHVGMGGLLHDIGKTKIPMSESDSKDEIQAKMQEHPTKGVEILEGHESVPKEVKMIIAQHHEHFDGSGFPKRLRGGQIYDLARIVAIANAFDELVGDAQGSLKDRQKIALQELESRSSKQFDPTKLQKVLKILRMGI
jgi:putative nucleotidyltransferase with HDIG domain